MVQAVLNEDESFEYCLRFIANFYALINQLLTGLIFNESSRELLLL